MTPRKLEVTWFSNPHEHSVHWIKLGLMRLHKAGTIRLRDIPVTMASSLLAPVWVQHEYRRGALLRLSNEDRNWLVYLDGEDAVFQTSPLLADCDAYFSCAFNAPFFQGLPFSMALPWQSPSELAPYMERYAKLQKDLECHLDKVFPLGPIGPALEFVPSLSWAQQKWRNLTHKLRQRVTFTVDWSHQHRRFEQRMQHLNTLRQSVPAHDVILRDSLWGWPRHRVALHERLAALAGRHDIRTQLSWRQAETYELGEHPAPDAATFPRSSGAPTPADYEAALATSRLGVFATEFHYGCRNIVTLAWYLGLRTYLDPLNFETGCDLSGLEICWNSDGKWSQLEYVFSELAGEGAVDRQRRQAWFDKYLAPEVLATRMLNQVTGTFS